jgi:flagellar biosynthetic protein FliR
LIALPLVVALLLVNIALAVISRAAPQLNIFSVGFPLTLTVGIWLVWLTMGSMDAHMVTSIQDGFEVIKNLLIV